MMRVGDVVIMRINHAPMRGNRWTEATVPGVTYRLIKVATTGANGQPVGYWPYPGSHYYDCRDAQEGDFTELLSIQGRAQKYWRGLRPQRGNNPGHFADFSTYHGAFYAVSGCRLRPSDLKQAV